MKRVSTVLLLLLLLISCGGPDQEYTESMAEQHAGDDTTATPMVQEPMMPVEGQAVTYNEAGSVGYIAIPEGADPDTLPGLIVIHEWWGLNENVRGMARRLAGEGYVALAVDLYGGQVAETPEGARELMGAALQGMDDVLANLVSAHAYLADELGVERVGSIGWCFGGGMSLNTGLELPEELDAMVIYYGRVETDASRLEPLQMPILGLFGAEDQGIPVEDVRAFEAALNDLGKDAEIHVYEGADHAFANPSGQNYDPEAAEDAWERTVAFFDEHLKQ